MVLGRSLAQGHVKDDEPVATPSWPLGGRQLRPHDAISRLPSVAEALVVFLEAGEDDEFAIEGDGLVAVPSSPRRLRHFLPSFPQVLGYPSITQQLAALPQAAEHPNATTEGNHLVPVACRKRRRFQALPRQSTGLCFAETLRRVLLQQIRRPGARQGGQLGHGHAQGQGLDALLVKELLNGVREQALQEHRPPRARGSREEQSSPGPEQAINFAQAGEAGGLEQVLSRVLAFLLTRSLVSVCARWPRGTAKELRLLALGSR
mmetsp:Transcript_102049/g.327478  ORF Transcript_102049/g.327478 Transcript_102049/m.327478 type:complete len:262 (-) Transcript_102049:1987-2772(-)